LSRVVRCASATGQPVLANYAGVGEEGEMRKLIKSKRATVVVQVLTGAGSLTALVAVLGAGLKWG